MAPDQPFCYVIMPFGRKRDPCGQDQSEIDFNAIYEEGIKPAIVDAGMSCGRADEEPSGGVVHKQIYERLLLSDFVIADLTTANPNVFYELGVRHASRRNTTLPICAAHVKLPFDVGFLDALPYELRSDNTFGHKQANDLRRTLANRLMALRKQAHDTNAEDSPLFQFVSSLRLDSPLAETRGLGEGSDAGGYRPRWTLRRIREVDRALYELLNRYAAAEQSSGFRDLLDHSERWRRSLAQARLLPEGAHERLRRIHNDMRPLEDREAVAILDLAMSYRAVGAWDHMITLYEDMPTVLKRSVLVREQLAFALNCRASHNPARPEYRVRAIDLLQDVIKEIDSNSYTYALLGTIRRDQWREARAAERPDTPAHLNGAIEAFQKGFHADWRDVYPGINLLRLLEIEGSHESLKEQERLLPIVSFAVEKRVASGEASYWDHATCLELALSRGEDARAMQLLSTTRANAGSHPWIMVTTARNLADVLEMRKARGVDVTTMTEIVDRLWEASRGSSRA